MGLFRQYSHGAEGVKAKVDYRPDDVRSAAVDARIKEIRRMIPRWRAAIISGFDSFTADEKIATSAPATLFASCPAKIRAPSD